MSVDEVLESSIRSLPFEEATIGRLLDAAESNPQRLLNLLGGLHKSENEIDRLDQFFAEVPKSDRVQVDYVEPNSGAAPKTATVPGRLQSKQSSASGGQEIGYRDFTVHLAELMAAFPVDAVAIAEVFKEQAILTEKLTSVALEAAEKSTEISSNWTKETLSELADLSKAKSDPTDYAKTMSDFASAQAEVAAENMAAFAEIAKKVQMDTVELMMAAGKELSEDATAAVKKAPADMTKAATKRLTK